MAEDKSKNSGSLKKAIREAFQTILEVREERQDLNAQLAEVRERMVQHGVSKPVFAFMQKYLTFDSEDREAAKAFFDVFNEVIDEHYSPDLFSKKKDDD